MQVFDMFVVTELAFGNFIMQTHLDETKVHFLDLIQTNGVFWGIKSRTPFPQSKCFELITSL